MIFDLTHLFMRKTNTGAVKIFNVLIFMNEKGKLAINVDAAEFLTESLSNY